MSFSLQILIPSYTLSVLGVGVIGVVEGDTHDIGKNLVKLMMQTAGFKMIDLGRDVKLQNFIDAAVENNADLICM